MIADLISGNPDITHMRTTKIYFSTTVKTGSGKNKQFYDWNFQKKIVQRTTFYNCYPKQQDKPKILQKGKKKKKETSE